jgi:hypothetical protein
MSKNMSWLPFVATTACGIATGAGLMAFLVTFSKAGQILHLL